MNKLLLYRLVSFLLLTAVIVASVPVHQIFHKHNYYQTDIGHAIHFKKTEKPCCKPFEGLSGNIVAVAKVNFLDQPSYPVYRTSFFAYFIKPLFDIANKAPPVSLA